MTVTDYPNSPQQTEPNLLEKQIQCFLSENLRLLDIPGLKLVEVEHAVSVGRIDILAKSSDQLLVAIETKRDLATREDVGQLQSYMGALQIEYPNANVKGILVAAGLTDGAQAALVVTTGIDFYVYQVQFTFRQKPLPKPLPPVLKPQAPTSVLRTERRYCMFCRDHVVANTMGNGSVICTRCRNAL
jgi:RecB family endonuclease NucS